MKKVLFITPYNPERRNVGDKVYTWDLLKSLRYHESAYVHVITYENNDDEKSKEALQNLANKVTYVPFKYKNRLKLFLSKYPASLANRYNKELINAVNDVLDDNHYNVVMVNMLKLTYLIDIINDYQCETVYISHNVESQVSKSIYKSCKNVFFKIIYWLDYLKTLFWEKRLVCKFDQIITICDNDADYFRTNRLGAPIVVRPIVEISNINKESNRESRKVILCGSFTWLPKKNNLNSLLDSRQIHLFAEENCMLEIVGRADRAEMEKGNKIKNVHVTGPVDDVHRYYEDATVAIVPELAGGGFKLKIAEAAQHKLPIVAIDGSITDYNMKPGIHYESAKDFDELIVKAINLVNNRPYARDIANSLYELFKQTYSIEAANNAITKVFEPTVEL